MKDNGRFNDELELLWDGYEYIVPQEDLPAEITAAPVAATC